MTKAGKVNYYIWHVYFAGSGFAYCENLTGLDDSNLINLLSGQKLSNPLPELTAESFSDGAIGDVFGCEGGTVVSDKLKKIIDNENVQFIPVIIPSSSLKFYLSNPLSIEEIIHPNASIVSYYESDNVEIEKLKKLVPVDEVAGASNLFRMKGRPDVIIVSEKLKNELQAVSKSAGKFTVAEKYQIGYY